MSNYITVEREAFERLCSLIRESHSVSEGINDQNAATNSTYSSTKIEEMLNDIIAEANTAVSEVDEKAEEALAIAKGKNRAHIFLTTEAMQAALSDEVNKDSYSVGDNLYIVDTEVPDWWIVEVLDQPDRDTGYYYKVAQLETQKVDLTDIIESIELANEEIEKLNEEAATHVPNTRTIAGIDLAEDIVADELRDNLPDFTSTSDSYMPNSKAGGLSIERIAGVVKQDKYEGKQLIPYPYMYGDKTQGGITFNTTNGSIKMTGTLSGTFGYRIISSQDNYVLPAGTYTLSGVRSKDKAYVHLRLYDYTSGGENYDSVLATDEGEGVTFTIETDSRIELRLNLLNGKTGESFDNIIVEPNLERGDIITEQEPYVGGVPSPNPMYPQEIQNVDITEIKSCGKNLLTYPYYEQSHTENGVTFTVNDDGSVRITGTPTATANLRMCWENGLLSLPVGTYIISGCESTDFRVLADWYDDTNTVLGMAGNSSTKPKFEVTEDDVTNGHKLGVSLRVYANGNEIDATVYPMISVSGGEYEPYKSSISTPAITCRAIEVLAVEDYTYEKDGKYYIADTVERTDDGYQMVQRIGKKVYGVDEIEYFVYYGVTETTDGSKFVTLLDNTTSLIHYRDNYNCGQISNYCICDKFSVCESAGAYNMAIYQGAAMFMLPESVGIGSSTAAQEWVQANPITLHYILEEPIITPISDSDATALLSLKTFDEATHISTNSAADALIDTKYGVTEVGAMTLNADNTALRAELRTKMLEAAMVNNI